jgi:hypothetical protein
MDFDADPEAWVRNIQEGGIPPKPRDFLRAVPMPHFDKPCQLRNGRHHPKKAMITFRERDHTYHIAGVDEHGNQVSRMAPLSVTGLKKRYFPSFDGPAAATAMVRKPAFTDPAHPDYASYERYDQALPAGSPPISWADLVTCLERNPLPIERLVLDNDCTWRALHLPPIDTSACESVSDAIELARAWADEIDSAYNYWASLWETMTDVRNLYNPVMIESAKQQWQQSMQRQWVSIMARFASLPAPETVWPARRPLTVDQVLAHWERNGIEQSNRGTFAHFLAEQVANGMPASEQVVEHHSIRAFFNDHPDLEAFLTEDEIFLGTVDSARAHGSILAGSVDALFRNRRTGKFVLVDWKRSIDLVRHERERANPRARPFPKKMCNGSLRHLEATIVNEFNMQLNLYKVMYTQYGITIDEMWVVCVHPACMGLVEYQDDDIDPACERVSQLLRQRSSPPYLKLIVPEMGREARMIMREWAQACMHDMPGAAQSAIEQLDAMEGGPLTRRLCLTDDDPL